MGRVPIGNNACCLPNVDGITYLQVGPRQVVIGMLGLDIVFQQLFDSGRKPEEVTTEELIGMARKYNYIGNNPAVEADYATALRKAYIGYFTRQERTDERTK